MNFCFPNGCCVTIGMLAETLERNSNLKFPSHRAAAFTGAMAIPLAVFGYDYAAKRHANSVFVFICFGLIGFLPMIFSAVDFADLKIILQGIRSLGISNIFQLRYTHYEDGQPVSKPNSALLRIRNTLLPMGVYYFKRGRPLNSGTLEPSRRAMNPLCGG